MLGERFARAAFDQAGSQAAREQLARALDGVVAARLPASDPAALLRQLVDELTSLGHFMRLEEEDPDMQLWGDFALISCDVVGHDLALLVHGAFDGATPIRIDRVEVLWQKT